MRASAMLLVLFVACNGGDDGLVRDPEICTNNVDDDLDGRVDCNDSDCWAACAEVCNDGDDLIDCVDPACDGQCAEICDDGRDNDLDGALDCDDSDCDGLCPEDCSNDIDDDLDGAFDCDDPDCESTCDADGDGFAALALGGVDCDDTNDLVNPDRPELCNGFDDDCDGDIDDADTLIEDAEDWYVDDDNDGWGSNIQKLTRCAQPAGTVPSTGDCDDGDPAVNPDALEVCNLGQDDDCNGLSDDGDPNLDIGSLVLWYLDGDGDGWGVPSTPILQCDPPPGRADNDDDCDDGNPLVLGSEPWLVDVDGDGFGAGAPSADSCSAPGPTYERQSQGVDCNDSSTSIYPGAPEVCADGVDQDCDGVDFLGCTDTGVFVSLAGDAVVTGGTYVGSEYHEFIGTSSGITVCEWTWTAMDWVSDPTAVGPDPFAGTPCTDYDGFTCDWRYSVHMSAGAMTDGYDCAFYGLTPAMASTAGPYGYGYMASYRALGINYGSTMMYHNPANPTFPPGIWISVELNSITPTFSNYTVGTGDWLYEWPDVTVLPAP